MISIRCLLAGGLAVAFAGCIAAPSEDEDDVSALVSNLTAEERRVRAGLIRDAADEVGLYNGLIIAGVANAETGMSQCWSELTWACEGPYSADCNGPVVAGAGDGPCELEQGGLGMFQFDAGTYAQTLEREGDRVLLIDGNVQAGIDFIIGMVKRSMYIPDVATDEEAIAWLNAVRPWNALWTPWIQTVVRYYNGCIPGVCGAYEARYENYGTKSITLLIELGAAFWYGAGAGCGQIPAEGATIDDADLCFGAGGNPAYWRDEAAGFDGSLLWTNATAAAAPSNYAIWTLRFSVPGDYLVEAYTDTAFAESMRAAYDVSHDGTVSVATIDQSAFDGFTPLGVFHFAANGDEHVRLDDDTGEPGSGMTGLVADALRVTPVASVPDGGVGTDGGVMPDGEVDAGTTPSHGGGCSATSQQQSTTEMVFVVLLALACVERRRVTRRVQRARSAR
jgi:hypothetical protein